MSLLAQASLAGCMGSEHCGAYTDSIWMYIINLVGWLIAGALALVGHRKRILPFAVIMYLVPIALVVTTYQLTLMRY